MRKLFFYIKSFGFFKSLYKLLLAIKYNMKYLSSNTLVSFSSLVYKSRLNSNVKISYGAEIKNSTIGFYSYVGQRTLIINSSIGNYCSIAHDVRIGMGSHPADQFSSNPCFYDKNFYSYSSSSPMTYEAIIGNITIGNDVWIGSSVLVNDGVTIGDGAIIAAGSVVTKNVKPYAIMGGVPAKLIRYRFSEETIKAIQNTEWWTKKPYEIDFNYLDTIMHEE